VSEHYDNLIAKIVAWGPDRESARKRLLRALSETEVSGVATTVPAHIVVLSHPEFVAAEHSTTWLTEGVDLSGIVPLVPSSARSRLAEARDIEVEVRGRSYQVRVWLPPDLGGLSDAGHKADKPEEADKDGRARRRGRAVRTTAGAGNRFRETRGSGLVTVPMQGTIVRVLVQPGDLVEAGQAVGVLEAMKMENNIVSEVSGRVIEVRAAPGSSVGTGDVIVVLES